MILIRNLLAICAVVALSGLFVLTLGYAIDETFKAPYATAYNTVGRGLE